MKVSSDELSVQLPMFVANILRDDLESVATLLKLLNDRELGCRAFLDKDLEDADVLRSVEKLVQDGWVQVLMYDPKQKQLVPSDTPPAAGRFSHEIWFRLTDLGRSKIENWTSPFQDGGT